MKPYKRRKLKFTRRYAVILLLAVGFGMGILVGCLLGFSQTGDSYSVLVDDVSTYLQTFHMMNTDKMDMFRASALKYSVFAIIIWVLAFVPAGSFLIFVLIMLRGVGYGFTTALLVRNFEVSGLICAAILYLAQFLILMPVYFFVAYHSINFIILNMNLEKTKKPVIVTEYWLALLVGCGFSVLVGFLDAFIVSGLVG